MIFYDYIKGLSKGDGTVYTNLIFEQKGIKLEEENNFVFLNSNEIRCENKNIDLSTSEFDFESDIINTETNNNIKDIKIDIRKNVLLNSSSFQQSMNNLIVTEDTVANARKVTELIANQQIVDIFENENGNISNIVKESRHADKADNYTENNEKYNIATQINNLFNNFNYFASSNKDLLNITQILDTKQNPDVSKGSFFKFKNDNKLSDYDMIISVGRTRDPLGTDSTNKWSYKTIPVWIIKFIQTLNANAKISLVDCDLRPDKSSNDTDSIAWPVKISEDGITVVDKVDITGDLWGIWGIKLKQKESS